MKERGDPLYYEEVKWAVVHLAQLRRFEERFMPRVVPSSTLYDFFRDYGRALRKLIKTDPAYEDAQEILDRLEKEKWP